EINGSRIGVSVQHLAPSPTSITRSEHAPFVIRAEGVAESGDIDEIGIIGMTADAADKPGLAQPQVTPSAARIRRFVDAVAVRHIEPDRGLTGAGINHVGIRARDLESPDCCRTENPIADAAPVDPAVNRLPHTAGTGAKIEHAAVFGIARDSHD